MKKLITSALCAILLVGCMASQLNLAQTIINDIVAFLPIVSGLLTNASTKAEAATVIAWLDKTTATADDILSNPTKAGYLKASADFTANVLPALPGLTPTQVAGLSQISSDIQKFIANNPPPVVTTMTAKQLASFGAIQLSRSELEKISAMKAQIQMIRAQLARMK